MAKLTNSTLPFLHRIIRRSLALQTALCTYGELFRFLLLLSPAFSDPLLRRSTGHLSSRCSAGHLLTFVTPCTIFKVLVSAYASAGIVTLWGGVVPLVPRIIRHTPLAIRFAIARSHHLQVLGAYPSVVSGTLCALCRVPFPPSARSSCLGRGCKPALKVEGGGRGGTVAHSRF